MKDDRSIVEVDHVDVRRAAEIARRKGDVQVNCHKIDARAWNELARFGGDRLHVDVVGGASVPTSLVELGRTLGSRLSLDSVNIREETLLHGRCTAAVELLDRVHGNTCLTNIDLSASGTPDLVEMCWLHLERCRLDRRAASAIAAGCYHIFDRTLLEFERGALAALGHMDAREFSFSRAEELPFDQGRLTAAEARILAASPLSALDVPLYFEDPIAREFEGFGGVLSLLVGGDGLDIPRVLPDLSCKALMLSVHREHLDASILRQLGRMRCRTIAFHEYGLRDAASAEALVEGIVSADRSGPFSVLLENSVPEVEAVFLAASAQVCEASRSLSLFGLESRISYTFDS